MSVVPRKVPVLLLKGLPLVDDFQESPYFKTNTGGLVQVYQGERVIPR